MNSFGPAHYVPILRWKRAEQGAMVDLFNLGTETSILTPLIELVPSQFIHNDNKRNISVGNQLLKTAVDIFKYWGNGPFFADLWLLPKDLRTETNSHPLVSLGHEARMRLLKLIPTTGLGRTRSYQSAVRSLVANDHLGVCIRLTLHEIENPKLESNLDGLLSYLSLKPEDADLVVDYQTINGSATSFPNLYTFLPHISEWRTFTVASGAFPDNLEGFNVGQHKHPRTDWIAWNRFVHTNSSPQKLPSYSDYTIQHPIYIELAPDIFPNFSASIR